MTASEHPTRPPAVAVQSQSPLSREGTAHGASPSRPILFDAGTAPNGRRPPPGPADGAQPITAADRRPEVAHRPDAILTVGPDGLPGFVHAFDRAVDRWCDHVRGVGALDTMAKAITGLGDHGLVWVLVAGRRGRRPGPERAQAVRALAVAGVGSSVVNAALKLAIGRSRPYSIDLAITAGGLPVRAPKTSSFPSGHTLAAFCSATVLSRSGHPGSTALLFATASLIATSRVHLGAHHASDVLGGAAIGVTIGLLGRKLL